MYLGTAYYPEHWPEERWCEDARMMRDAGINMVRMGEFAWSAIEPREGQYNFGWLERAIDLFADYGIQTLMCTFSRTPPPWVFHKYPEIRNVDVEGHTLNYGHRYTVDLNNPAFIHISQKVDQAVIKHFAKYPGIIGWHIDNEIGSGHISYSRYARQAFQDYLRQQYGSIEELNRSWGKHFWSFAFNDFDEIPVPREIAEPDPTLAMAWARFNSYVHCEFARWRFERIRENDPDSFITTNFDYRGTDTDIFQLGHYLDINGTNYYPPRMSEFTLDYCRGASPTFMVLEQRSGQPRWSPATKPGWMRLWAWRSIAHGACAINFFRWRPCRWGQEQYWHGILPHSGRKNRRYHELAQMGEELGTLADIIDKTQPEADTAILMNYESRWGFDAVNPPEQMRVCAAAAAYHESLMTQNMCVDAMDTREDLSSYKLIIAPRLYCVDERTVTNLETFVKSGGVLCLTPRSGVADFDNKIFDQPVPGPLRSLAGVEVDDYSGLEQPVALRSSAKNTQGSPRVSEGALWADEIQLSRAEVITTFDSDWLKGAPAITVHQYGRGMVIYIGTVLQGEDLNNFTSWLCCIADAKPVLEQAPQGVRAFKRVADDFTLLFLMNFGDEKQSVDLGESWERLTKRENCQKITLEPTQVEILRRNIK